ncbi:MAG: transposase [Gammaproteobacteria bacterium]|nr:transposase [Gammaproteobacteria bacterium]
MGRAQRIARGGLAYHVLNRANGRRPIFQRVADYIAFETVMAKTCDRIPMRILAWCLMPNHWHLVLWPRRDGDLSQFMRLLTLTHTQRWHAAHETTGNGHLSQTGALQVIPDPGRCPSPRMKRFLTPFSGSAP